MTDITKISPLTIEEFGEMKMNSRYVGFSDPSIDIPPNTRLVEIRGVPYLIPDDRWDRFQELLNTPFIVIGHPDDEELRDITPPYPEFSEALEKEFSDCIV